jgi:hypothetical protein
MRSRAFLIFLFLTVAQNACAERYALLIGNSTATGNFATLKYVQNDLSSVQNILTGFCGFSKQHVTTLLDRSPTELEHALEETKSHLASRQGNLFLFYYSGHADANALKMGDADFSLAKLKESLSEVPADIRIGVFDACQSGSFTRIKGGTLSEPFLFRDDGKTKGQVFLCASSINENAQESDVYGNSIFTFHFVNALRGSADNAGDGRITLGEAYQYAYNHTVASTVGSSGGIQHPSYQFRIQGEGDIVLADLNISTRGILLSNGVEGDITVVRDGGAVVADLSKKSNAAVMIAVLPGAYRVLVGNADQRYETKAVVTEQSVATIHSSDFRRVASSPSNAKGERFEKGAQIGITVSGSAGMFDLSDLSNSLAQRFAGFSAYSILPAFPYKKYQVVPMIAGEVIIRKRFEAHLGFGGFSATSNENYSGMSRSPANNSPYGCKLNISRTLDVKAIDIGGGYRFQQRYIKNSSIHVGIVAYQPVLTVASVFNDSLYNEQTSGSQTCSAWAVVPYAALGYTYPILKFLDVGAKVRYRWQYRPVQFDNDYEGSLPIAATTANFPLSCSFGGFDGSVLVNIHLSFTRQEEQQ